MKDKIKKKHKLGKNIKGKYIARNKTSYLKAINF
jgi:hypothetical protein